MDITTSDVANAIMIVEGDDPSTLEVLEAYALLIRDGIVWNLQGSHGRAAHRFIQAGLISQDGTITDAGHDLVASIEETEEF